MPIQNLKNGCLIVHCLYGYRYSLVLLETWYSEDEGSLLRNVNNYKYSPLIFSDLSHGFVSYGFVLLILGFVTIGVGMK